MFVGMPNPNLLIPLEKMSIQNLHKKTTIYVLYNPESYEQTRSISLANQSSMSSNMPIVQFVSGGAEQLHFTLFFDSLSAGAEIGGTKSDRAKFAVNSLLPSAQKQIDVRTYTERIYKLMRIDPSLHAPPRLKLEWASLQFTGYLVNCTQKFVKFNEQGTPVRATLDCTFQEYVEPGKIASLTPNESPDTTKYRTVTQGDALWSLAAREYGQPAQWREIANANGLTNPRKLRTGDMLVLPGLD